MSNEDGTLWIAFNGEIFNYVELQRDVVRAGHRLSSRSDTEVILHLYEEHGTDCVGRLNGQWAFVIWDERNRTLFLSRDRLGVRPLFYTETRQSFLFASEIKALLEHPDVGREIDLRALDQILTFWVTIPPRTAFRDVAELPPGHSMLVNGSERTIWRHWSLDPEPAKAASEHDLALELLDLLEDATRLRLRADVPVGAYLSGGLDSSVTTALMLRLTRQRAKTFSIVFEDNEFDERTYQRKTVDYFGVDHHESECSYRSIAQAFPEVVRHTEKPILRTAPAPLFLLSRLVRDHGFKVVLTGEGADEVLGGYDIYKETKIREFWARRPDSRLRPQLLRRLYPYLPGFRRQSTAYLKAFFHVQDEVLDDPFFSHLPRWQTTAMVKQFLSAEVRSELADHDALADLAAILPTRFQSWDRFTRAQYLETVLLLPGYILSSQGDRVAMAHSVEGRFPFLDHRVVEFSFRLPAKLKMKVLQEKYLLKRAAVDLVPAEVRLRSKQPFRAPDVTSFFDPRSGETRAAYVDPLLAESAIRRNGIFDPRRVSSLVQKARTGGVFGFRDNMAFVGILSLQLLMEQMVRHGSFEI